MDQTKIHWHVDSLMVLIQKARLFLQVQTLVTVEKNIKTISLLHQQDQV